MNIAFLYDIFLSSTGISTDTRSIRGGELFFALKGDNFDGNAYVVEAMKAGCLHIVCEDDKYSDLDNVTVVSSSLLTLQGLANFHRRQISAKVLAITGSNGKTTSKELVHAVLKTGMKVFATQGNLNNHIGVPLSLLSITDEEVAVIEMGANHPGEIALLCGIAEPDAGIITNVGKAHLEGFGSLDGVRKAKGELFDYLARVGGTAIVNGKDSTVSGMAEERNMNIFYFEHKEALQGIITQSSPTIKGLFSYNNEQFEFESDLFGIYNFSNILYAIAAGLFFRIRAVDIPGAIKSYIPENNRSQFLEGKSNKIILDAYNANPSSMTFAITDFLARESESKMFILGDMMELGADSKMEHKKILELLLDSGQKEVYLVGENFRNAKDNRMIDFSFFPSVEQLLDFIVEFKPNAKTILLKGSRKIALEQTTKLLLDC